MEQYNLDLIFWKEPFDNFKQKHADLLIKVISGCMLNQHIKFNSYGKAEFDKDDVWRKHPTVNCMPEFTKNKVNCLVFDVFNAEYDNYVMPYDKLFIYFCDGKVGSYGYVFFNSETKKSSHVFCIEYAYDELCKRINSEFNSISNYDMINKYSDKYYLVKGKKKYRSELFTNC